MASTLSRFVPLRGYEVIDHCHQKVNQLMEEAVGLASGSEGDYKAKLAEFRAYVASHFGQEEVMMRGTGFSGAQAHASLHAKVLDRIDMQLATITAAFSAKNRLDVARTLESMLLDHEVKDDAAFHDYYERLGGSTATWGENLLVGVAWADEEHKALLAQLNEVDRSLQDGEPSSATRGHLDRFVLMARQHFGHEEAELAKNNAARLANHHASHASLLKDLEDLLSAYDAESSALLAIDYLKFWVIDHIRRVDCVDFA